jgi:hypothetical protein
MPRLPRTEVRGERVRNPWWWKFAFDRQPDGVAYTTGQHRFWRRRRAVWNRLSARTRARHRPKLSHWTATSNGPRFSALPNKPVDLDLNRIDSPLHILTTRAVVGSGADSQLYNRLCVALRRLEDAHTTRYIQWRLVVATVFQLWAQLHKLHRFYSYAVTDLYMYRVPDGLSAHELFRARRCIPNQVARAFGIPHRTRLGYRMRIYDDGQGFRLVPTSEDSDDTGDAFQCQCSDCTAVIDLTGSEL